MRKSHVSMAAAVCGCLILPALFVMFCFSELRIPSFAYAAVWFSCLYIIWRAVSPENSRRSPHRRKYGGNRSYGRAGSFQTAVLRKTGPSQVVTAPGNDV